MNDYMKALIDQFYTPMPDRETEQLQHSLGEQLTVEQRKLLLRIIDAKNLYCENATLDSFIAGFRLAADIAKELDGGWFSFENAEDKRAGK